jgi:hypothetical protein
MICEHSGVTERQRELLLKLMQSLRNLGGSPSYIEIGVLYGGNLRRVLEKLHDGEKGYGLDLFEMYEDYDRDQTHAGNVCSLGELATELKSRGLNNFVLLAGDSAKTILQLPTIPCGVALIDGNHTFEAVADDMKAVNERLLMGYVAFHDVDTTDWGVDKYLATKEPEKMGWSYYVGIPGMKVCRKCLIR